MIGRISPEKQPQLFLDAVAELGDEWVGVLAGHGTVVGRKNSIILPPTNHPGNLLAIADVYVQPSLFESHCLAINEAWLAGVPVVSTDYPVNRWFVHSHGKIIDLVPVQCSPSDLARMISNVNSDVKLAKRVAQQHYTVDLMCRRWSDYLWSISRPRS